MSIVIASLLFCLPLALAVCAVFGQILVLIVISLLADLG